MPDVQGIDSFDHGFDVGPDYDQVFTVAQLSAVTSPLYQERLNSLRVDVIASTNIGVRKNITGSPSRGWTGFPLMIDDNPVTSSISVLGLHSVTSNIQARLAVSTGGVLFAFIGGGSNQNGPTLTLDTFYWIEVIYDVSAATHELLWRVNGVDQTTATVAATGSDSIDYGQLVTVSGSGTGIWYAGGYWSWGSAISDTDWLGEPSPPSSGEYFIPARRRGF